MVLKFCGAEGREDWYRQVANSNPVTIISKKLGGKGETPTHASIPILTLFGLHGSPFLHTNV